MIPWGRPTSAVDSPAYIVYFYFSYWLLSYLSCLLFCLYCLLLLILFTSTYIVYFYLYCLLLLILFTPAYIVYFYLYCLLLLILFTPAYIVYSFLYCLLLLILFNPAYIVYSCLYCLLLLILFTPAYIVYSCVYCLLLRILFVWYNETLECFTPWILTSVNRQAVYMQHAPVICQLKILHTAYCCHYRKKYYIMRNVFFNCLIFFHPLFSAVASLKTNYGRLRTLLRYSDNKLDNTLCRYWLHFLEISTYCTSNRNRQC